MTDFNRIFSGAARCLAIVLSALAVSGCNTMAPSTAMPADVRTQGLVLKHDVPSKLPEGSKRLAGSQLILVPTDSAVGLVVPLPFVADIATNAYHSHEATTLAARYAGIDVFDLVQRAMGSRALIHDGAGKNTLFAVAYLVDCDDAVFRVALSGRVESGPWTGRYTVHLPTALSEHALAAGAPETIAALTSELSDAAVILRSLIERDAADAFRAGLYRADVGSLHLNCGKVAGLVSPKMLLARNAEVLEDGAGHIVVRAAGDLGQSGPSGGLMYGVHYLRRDQVHTFNRKP